MSDFQNRIVKAAAKHVEISGAMFGIELDYSNDSILVIDRAISEFHPGGAALDSTLIGYGSYVGETIRHNLGGEWAESEDTGPFLHTVGGTDTTIYPFDWTRKRFENGFEDSIAYKYSFLMQETAADEETQAAARAMAEAVAVLGEQLAAVAPASGEGVVEEGDIADLIARAPMLIFFIVAGADGNIDKKEMNQFIKIVGNPHEFECDLFLEALDAVAENHEGFLGEIQELSDVAQELSNTAATLDSQHPNQAADFKMCLLTLGRKIAEASGGLLGMGNKISKEEATALATIAVLLGLMDPSEIEESD